MSSGGPVFQNAVYVGINLENILYGIELVLYFRTMHTLLSRKERRHKSDAFYAIFSSVMLMMITIWVSTQAIFGEKMWLEDRNFPGGPDAYWASNISIWYMDMGTTAITILQLMTDGLMIYRCRMLWDSNRIVIVPAILWVSTLGEDALVAGWRKIDGIPTSVLGILVIWTSSSPGGNFFSGVAAQLGLAYYCMSVGLTAMLTGVICYRMVRQGQRAKKQLGRDYAGVYFAVLSVVVESVLPYTLSGVAFLASFGAGSEATIGFACVYILMMCISPQMLILRVASGQGLNEETVKVISTRLTFLHGEASGLTESRFGDSGATVNMNTPRRSNEKEVVKVDACHEC